MVVLPAFIWWQEHEDVDFKCVRLSHCEIMNQLKAGQITLGRKQHIMRFHILFNSMFLVYMVKITQHRGY